MDSSAQVLQREAAKFLSLLKNVYKTSQKSVDFVISSVNKFTDLYLDVLKDKVSEKLAHKDGYLSVNDINFVLGTFSGQSLFEGVKTASAVENYIEQLSSNCRVGLKKVVLKKKMVVRKGVPMFIPLHFGYVMPFLEQLQQLLNVPEVLECVRNPRPVEEGVFKTVSDGYFARYHPLVVKYGPKVLMITIYVDDVEITDPCKSKVKKHRLRLFYWTLANIYPEYRSSLKAINLLAVVKTSVAKEYGNEKFLKVFVGGMCALEEGVTFTIQESEEVFHGALIMADADIPAAANLGGYKESHFALRPCRMCMVTKQELCTHFKERLDLLRTAEEHEKFLQAIDHVSLQEETEVVHELNEDEVEEEDLEDINMPSGSEKYRDHENPSVNYGINSRSLLLQIPYFDVTKCLPYDIMHTLLEGVVERLCKLLLKDACFPPKQNRRLSKKHLQLSDVNSVVQELCDLGHWNVYRPSIIDKAHLTSGTSKLRQSAIQMLVLAHMLPFILKGYIEVDKLSLLNCLLSLVDLSMSFELSDNDILKIESLVEEFGSRFVVLYPQSKTLKLHSLIHLPLQIRLFGPPRQHWCFRFESFHTIFTDYVRVIHNMRNVEFTLAKRYWNKRNTEIMEGKTDGNFLCSDEVITTAMCPLSEISEKECILLAFPKLDEDYVVKVAKRVKRNGSVYKKGVYLLMRDNEEDALKSYGIIEKVLIVDGEVAFIMKPLETNYDPHLRAHEIIGGCGDLTCFRFEQKPCQPRPVVRLSFKYRRALIVYLLKMHPHDV